jgi:hypothetical protein
VDIINKHPSSISIKTTEIFNLSATVTSCSTMKPSDYNSTNVRHRRFNEHAAKCAELASVIWERESYGPSESNQNCLDAIDSCPEIEKNLQEMRDIAEQIVGLSMGRNRYRMGG